MDKVSLYDQNADELYKEENTSRKDMDNIVCQLSHGKGIDVDESSTGDLLHEKSNNMYSIFHTLYILILS